MEKFVAVDVLVLDDEAIVSPTIEIHKSCWDPVLHTSYMGIELILRSDVRSTEVKAILLFLKYVWSSVTSPSSSAKECQCLVS